MSDKKHLPRDYSLENAVKAVKAVLLANPEGLPISHISGNARLSAGTTQKALDELKAERDGDIWFLPADPDAVKPVANVVPAPAPETKSLLRRIKELFEANPQGLTVDEITTQLECERKQFTGSLSYIRKHFFPIALTTGSDGIDRYIPGKKSGSDDVVKPELETPAAVAATVKPELVGQPETVAREEPVTADLVDPEPVATPPVVAESTENIPVIAENIPDAAEIIQESAKNIQVPSEIIQEPAEVMQPDVELITADQPDTLSLVDQIRASVKVEVVRTEEITMDGQQLTQLLMDTFGFEDVQLFTNWNVGVMISKVVLKKVVHEVASP